MINFNQYKKIVQGLLAGAGIKVNGDKSWDIQIKDDRVYQRFLTGNTLGMGETYMAGWWDVKELDKFFEKVFKARLNKYLKKNLKTIISIFRAKFLNLQDVSHAFDVGMQHYDIGNDLYKAMLDKRMVYTCAYWEDAKNIDEAQENKLDLVCRKLKLRSGQKILDIGCGWGSFAKYAAEKYGVSVVGITVSKEQVDLGNRICADLPVEIRLQDYREVNEKFDHIVSLGMFEHVGNKNYRAYMSIVNKNLKMGGLFLLHTIGCNKSKAISDAWLLKYIFPNSMLPAAEEIIRSSKGLFIMEDWHNFGLDYDKTLLAWFSNFDKNWNNLKEGYNETFYRMWKYYLLSSAALFRTRKTQLWQIVFSKQGTRAGYLSIR
ncbi:MAG: cyclopropane fatty acyl phospholipid synthase [Patescibacteria group bacterium]|nr:cyclopropane fatty acyl phospholipid synthase [Patescibacteria group bacterium]